MSLKKSTLGDFEEDHAVIAARKMDLLLKRFCTPIASKRRSLATEFLNTFYTDVEGTHPEAHALIV